MHSTISIQELAEFRARLPRLADLHDRFRADSHDNFFRKFATRYDGSEVTRHFYEQIERDLSFIPALEWNSYAAKVGAVVNLYDKARRREWEQLFNVFSEAFGARVLVEKYGCDLVRLVSTNGGKTCDWFGSSAGSLRSLRRDMAKAKPEVTGRVIELLERYGGISAENITELTRTPAMKKVLKGRVAVGPR